MRDSDSFWFIHTITTISSSTSGSTSKEFLWRTMTDSATLYPLGRNIYASVKTWRRSVKIHIRHYVAPTNTQGGRVIATRRGVALDLKEFQRLCKVKNKLSRMFATRSEPSSYGNFRSRPCPSTRITENRRQRSVSRGDPTVHVTHVEEPWRPHGRQPAFLLPTPRQPVSVLVIVLIA